jgi:hypothetical protein
MPVAEVGELRPVSTLGPALWTSMSSVTALCTPPFGIGVHVPPPECRLSLCAVSPVK